MTDRIKVNEVLDLGRHCRVTPQGRVFSYSALVLIGTGDGTAGIGYGNSRSNFIY
jgi:ribosomal protein S5